MQFFITEFLSGYLLSFCRRLFIGDRFSAITAFERKIVSKLIHTFFKNIKQIYSFECLTILGTLLLRTFLNLQITNYKS